MMFLMRDAVENSDVVLFSMDWRYLFLGWFGLYWVCSLSICFLMSWLMVVLSRLVILVLRFAVIQKQIKPDKRFNTRAINNNNLQHNPLSLQLLNNHHHHKLILQQKINIEHTINKTYILHKHHHTKTINTIEFKTPTQHLNNHTSNHHLIIPSISAHHYSPSFHSIIPIITLNPTIRTIQSRQKHKIINPKTIVL